MINLKKINYLIGGIIVLLVLLSFVTFKEKTFDIFLGNIYNFGNNISNDSRKSSVQNLVEEKINSTAVSDITDAGNKEKISYEEQVKIAKSMPFSKGKIEEAFGAENKFKIFDVKITEKGFNPSTIVIKKGDVVQLNFISDFDTDIESKDLKFFGFITKGKEFNFSILTKYSGTYTFYCLNMCPPEGRFFGILEVRD